MSTYTVNQSYSFEGVIRSALLTDAWNAFCGDLDCRLDELFYSSSCTNHVALISIDMFLLLMFLLSFISKLSSSSQMQRPSLAFQGLSPLQRSCTVINGGIVLSYLGLGMWMLGEQLRKTGAAMPLHQWLELLLQGISWLGICPIIHIFPENPTKSFKWSRSAIAVILGGFVSVSSVLEVSRNRAVTVKTAIDFLCLPGGIILLLCALKAHYGRANGEIDIVSLYYTPLEGQADVISTTDSCDCVTPFAKAGFLRRIFFCWLNPLMRKGYKKPLDDGDVPLLHEDDRAEACYKSFVEQLNKKGKVKHITSPSVFWALFYCHLTDIIVTGFCALLKTLTLSSGPILLNMFVKFSEKEDGGSRREGFALAAALFFIKFSESLSQRQWYFRSRKLGLQVKSQLSAAIYKKQFRLSNLGRMEHSSGEIMNYVTVDAYRIGEFPFWFHQTWTMSLQLCFAMAILYNAVGAAAISALLVMLLTVLCNTPLAKLQLQFHAKLMGLQDTRLKAVSEALVNMKILKLYAWEKHFKNVIEGLREEELKSLSAFQLGKAYSIFVYWTALVFVSAASFSTCYLLKIPLYPSNVFTFVATIRLVQEPVRTIPDLVGVIIQAKVSLGRIVTYLDAPELQIQEFRRKVMDPSGHIISIASSNFSWEGNALQPTLKNIDLKVKCMDKVAICGEVGSGKSSLLAAILGEIPSTEGQTEVRGRIAYVSQSAWIPTGTLQENILFGSAMDEKRYQETLEKCSLVMDLDMLPFGDLTEIGERGVNLSGGQKQRLQLARALYQDADIYLLDDPFSAVDAHTAVSLFNNYVIGALPEKTVILVTHQVDFLPAFNFLLLMSNGRILHSAPFSEVLATSRELQDLVNAHKDVSISGRQEKYVYGRRNKSSPGEITHIYSPDKFYKKIEGFERNQLIKKEEREIGEMGIKPYLLYLNQNNGYLYFALLTILHIIFLTGLISQNSWLAENIQNPQINQLRLIIVYLILGCGVTVFLFARCMLLVILNLRTSKSLFNQLLESLFHAPMSFFDSTPLGRILTRVSSDLNIVDLDVPFALMYSVCTMLNTFSSLGVLAFVTWQVLPICVPMVYLTIRLQNYYLATGKELMRINGTTKSILANHLAESVAGAITIRAFEEEEHFIAKNFELIDQNASPIFHNSAATEWLILWLETMSAVVLSSSALVVSLLPEKTFTSGFIGMALSYGLSLNMSLVFCIQSQCTLTNYIISVERLNQYMHIPSEGEEVIEGNRPPKQWPSVGVVEFQNLKIRYRPDFPLVLKGISCTFEGGYKIGIVGRTGSGKTTLVSALFRLVEPAAGKIYVDGLDISTIGVHDLRSRLAIIPQEPTLFNGTIRYNLDPLGQHTDQDIWEVLQKCQLHESVKDKDKGLESLVTEDGSNWSLGQRQLFCLCRALLRRIRILVLDEATASIDNATDSILQKIIRSEFAESTVITVAHRIPTVMDCTMVLAISDGKLVEFERPEKLMQNEASLFMKLVKEYWSYAAVRHTHSSSFRSNVN